MNRKRRNTWLGLGVIVVAVGGWLLWNASSTNGPSFGKIAAPQAYDLLRRSDASADLVMLDVRTAEEHALGYLPALEQEGLNLDFYATDFQTQLSQLDREQTYLVYCRSGNRSSQTVALMQKMGFKRLYNLEGGVLAWEAQGLSLERP